MGKFLKISRIAIALCCFVMLSLFLVGFAGQLSFLGQWISRVQILPAALAFSLGWFIFWLMVTLLFGRLYCSTVCPMGTLMDIFSRLARRGSYGREYRYSAPLSRVRLIAFFLVLAAIVTEMAVVISLFDPYQAYDRIATDIERPALMAANNVVSEAGYLTGWWHTPAVEVAVTSFLSLVVALVTLVVVAWTAWRSGRTICNTICPVGTTLGFVSRYSVIHFDIDTDLCTQCRRCEYVCKSSCIDLNDHVVDGSRCVTCFNCVAACPTGAMRYTAERKQLSIPMMQRTRRTLSRPTAMEATPTSPLGNNSQLTNTSNDNEAISRTAKPHNDQWG